MADDTPISPTTGRRVPKSQTYEGGCHCGKVSYTVKLSPPLTEMPVTRCNCSICTINGQLMVYPLESQITWHSGRDGLTGYSFGPARVIHSFCPVCGTSIGGKSNEGTFADYRALNVRAMRGVDIDKLNYRAVDGRKDVPTQDFS